uniref:GK20391 n=1 Tax=Drosophila willistoni TaxID=7260 RepID=B4N538_DROWI
MNPLDANTEGPESHEDGTDTEIEFGAPSSQRDLQNVRARLFCLINSLCDKMGNLQDENGGGGEGGDESGVGVGDESGVGVGVGVVDGEGEGEITPVPEENIGDTVAVPPVTRPLPTPPPRVFIFNGVIVRTMPTIPEEDEDAIEDD